MQSSRIGPFALEGRLGADNAGNVYRAVQVEQRRTVALKLFAAPFMKASQQAKQAFVKEAKALKQLDHPHLVRCFGAGLVDMRGYLALELVEGETLRDLMDRRGKLTSDAVIDLGIQICSGLQYAHDAGLLHLDLMPDKILLTETQQVKIADFRVDRPNNPLCETSHRRTLQRVTYMSPEMLRSGQTRTEKADLYSLGCILFEALTGRPPLAGETAEAIRQQHLTVEPPRVTSLELDCPVWLDVLVDQLLAKLPPQRPHGAGAVMLALKEAQKKIAAGTSVVEHATRGFSPLRMPADKEEANRLLASKTPRNWFGWLRELRETDFSPVFQSVWFLVACLAAICGVFAWALWPSSPQQLLAEAETLMASEDRDAWRKAKRDYLQPLVSRHADSPFADRAQELLDQVEMAAAEDRARFNARLGRTPSSRGEELYIEARRYQQFGDPVTARARYEQIVQSLEPTGKNRAFVMLAERRIAEIEQLASQGRDQTEFVQQQMSRADELAAAGNFAEAHSIWRGIVTLYSEDPQMRELVQQARQKLSQP